MAHVGGHVLVARFQGVGTRVDQAMAQASVRAVEAWSSGHTGPGRFGGAQSGVWIRK